MIWQVRVSASTHLQDGGRRRMCRYEEGAGDVIGAMRRALNKRRDGGSPFLGEEITAITPTGQKIVRIFNPDTCTLDRVRNKPILIAYGGGWESWQL